MKLANWFLVLLVFALLGSVAIPRYVPESFRPDLFVIMMVFVAICAPRDEALPLCWLIGLAKDLVSGEPLGGYAVLHLAAGFAILRARDATNTRLVVVQALLGFLAALGTESLHFLIASARARLRPTYGDLRTLVMASLLTALLAPICVWALRRFTARLRLRRRYRFGTG